MFWTHLIFYLLIRITFNDLWGVWWRADVTAGLIRILAMGFFLRWACSALVWGWPVMWFLKRCWKAAASWTSGQGGQTSAAKFTTEARDKAEVMLMGLGSSCRSVSSVSPRQEVKSSGGEHPVGVRLKSALSRSEITMPNAVSMNLWRYMWYLDWLFPWDPSIFLVWGQLRFSFLFTLPVLGFPQIL